MHDLATIGPGPAEPELGDERQLLRTLTRRTPSFCSSVARS